jgi:creatinine amidohydrolase
VLPIGSFEQHGAHLPLATDTIIAAEISARICARYEAVLLPPVAFGCSHEHADFPGTVSISATTLFGVLRDVAESLSHAGFTGLALVNGHGGNYVLSNVAQELSRGPFRVALYPTRVEWQSARNAARLATDMHEDMHAGELETSLLMHTSPDLVREGHDSGDHTANDRRHLLTLGLASYTRSGVIGRPSLASADKGRLLLDSLVADFGSYMAVLGSRTDI